jgi:hypothetical protein
MPYKDPERKREWENAHRGQRSDAKQAWEEAHRQQRTERRREQRHEVGPFIADADEAEPQLSGWPLLVFVAGMIGVLLLGLLYLSRPEDPPLA